VSGWVTSVPLNDVVNIALIDRKWPRGNRAAPYDAQAAPAGMAMNCVSVHVAKVLSFLNVWQVRASRNFFGVLLFFDMKSRDTHTVIVLQRNLHGFMKVNGTWSC
jgi:hypothetical protein